MAQAMPGLGFFLRNVALELLELSPLKGLKNGEKNLATLQGVLAEWLGKCDEPCVLESIGGSQNS